jgi:hypothetical protein
MRIGWKMLLVFDTNSGHDLSIAAQVDEQRRRLRVDVRRAYGAVPNHPPATSAAGRPMFDRSLDRGECAFERCAGLVDNDLSQQRTSDTGQPFLLRPLQRQQVEAQMLRRTVLNAHRHIERRVEIMSGVQLLDGDGGKIASLRSATIDDGMV